MRYLALALLAPVLLLGACSETKPIPPDFAKLGQLTYAKPVEGVPATVVFVRDLGFLDVGQTAYVTIDGETAAKLQTAEKVTIDLTAGDHVFGVGKMLLPVPATATLDARLAPGQTYVYRLVSDATGMRIESAK